MKSQWMLVACAFSLCSLAAHGGRFENQFDADASRTHDVQVGLQSEMPFVPATEDVRVNLTFANTGRKAVTLTRWFVPSEDFDEPLFSVTRDGVAVDYLGPIVKRPAPTAEDLIVLRPGEVMTVPVELSGTYDFSAGGEYAIRYRTRSAHLFGPGQVGVEALSSASISITVDCRSYSNVHVVPGDGIKVKPGEAIASSVAFSGRCSGSQQSTLLAAVGNATSMALEATDYLSSPPSATPRYTTWFGAFTSSGWNTATNHFAAIADAFATKPLTLDCKCRKKYYAYVYPNQPYKIYVCALFWKAPQTGTDSQAGTLIHEMSHFDVVAGTNDWAYGQSAAQTLAASDPERALDNADHEYFAENTPVLQ